MHLNHFVGPGDDEHMDDEDYDYADNDDVCDYGDDDYYDNSYEVDYDR